MPPGPYEFVPIASSASVSGRTVERPPKQMGWVDKTFKKHRGLPAEDQELRLPSRSTAASDLVRPIAPLPLWRIAEAAPRPVYCGLSLSRTACQHITAPTARSVKCYKSRHIKPPCGLAARKTVGRPRGSAALRVRRHSCFPTLTSTPRKLCTFSSGAVTVFIYFWHDCHINIV